MIFFDAFDKSVFLTNHVKGVYCNKTGSRYGEELIVSENIDNYLKSTMDAVMIYSNILSIIDRERSGFDGLFFIKIPSPVLFDIYFLHSLENVKNVRFALLVDQSELLVDSHIPEGCVERLFFIVNTDLHEIWLSNVEWEGGLEVTSLISQYGWEGVTLKTQYFIDDNKLQKFVGLIDFCKKCKSKTIITNVDSHFQFDHSVKLGADFSQGFYFLF